MSIYPENPEPSLEEALPIDFGEWSAVVRKCGGHVGKIVVSEIKSPLLCAVDEVSVTSHTLRDMPLSHAQADARVTERIRLSDLGESSH